MPGSPPAGNARPERCGRPAEEYGPGATGRSPTAEHHSPPGEDAPTRRRRRRAARPRPPRPSPSPASSGPTQPGRNADAPTGDRRGPGRCDRHRREHDHPSHRQVRSVRYAPDPGRSASPARRPPVRRVGRSSGSRPGLRRMIGGGLENLAGTREYRVPSASEAPAASIRSALHLANPAFLRFCQFSLLGFSGRLVRITNKGGRLAFPAGAGIGRPGGRGCDEAPPDQPARDEARAQAMASEKQVEANRRNALRSTGPRTADGKARSRLNAVTHGLTAQTLILPEEDPRSITTASSPGRPRSSLVRPTRKSSSAIPWVFPGGSTAPVASRPS